MNNTREKAAIIAGGTNKWGIRKATFRDLISEVGEILSDSYPNLDFGMIDGLVLSTVIPERLAYQGHPAPLAAEILGINPHFFFRIENQCGSGTAGVMAAYSAVLSGMANCVLVVGVEKMNMPRPEEYFIHALAGFDREWEAVFGITPPPVFSMIAKEHMRKYGTTEEQLALVSVKNHRHSEKNPNAHFTNRVTMEDVMNSKPIASPIKLFDCSPITDGAAAVVVAKKDIAQGFSKEPVFIMGARQALHGYTMANIHRDWSSWPLLRESSKILFDELGIRPSDIDVAELHDCFTISEIMLYEELGFCEKGEGGKFVESGLSDYGGDVVVNPRGGLIGCGHPLGATGVAQAAEIFLQLSGKAGERQVPDAKIGLSQTLSNIGSEQHMIVYGRGL